MKKIVSVIMLTLLVGMLTSAFNLSIAGYDGVAGEDNLSSSTSSTPPSLVWSKTYGGDAEDHAYCVRQTVDGGYILVGYTYSFGAGNADVWLVKTGWNGNIEWNRTYGGAEDDYARSVQQTNDGGYIFAGRSYSFSEYGDIYVIKTDSYGNVEWNITSIGEFPVGGVTSVQQTSDGGYILGGGTLLVKIDANGNTEWYKILERDESHYWEYWAGYSVQQTSDDGYMLAGEGSIYNRTSGEECGFWLAKTDANGNMEWTYIYGRFGFARAFSGQQTSDGGYMVAGYLAHGAWLVKTDTSGNMEWNATYGEAHQQVYSSQQTSDGGYILAGKASPYRMVWLVKTDTSGNMEWNVTYGEYDWVAEYVQQTSDGGYIVAGFTHYYYESPPSDFFLMKLGLKHDVAITNVQSSKSMVAQNNSVSINATVENQGNFTETFDVTAYTGITAVDTTIDITLTSGNSTTVTFNWNTTGFMEGVYTISAAVEPVPGEVETADNTYVGGLVFVGVGPPRNVICVSPPLADNLQKSNIFVVEVWINILDTAGVPGNPGCFDYSYRFYWNDALLEMQSYKGYPPQDVWNQDICIWRDELIDRDGDTKNDEHSYRVIAIGWDPPGLTGFRKIMDYTFKVLHQRVLPEPNITSTLDIHVGTFSDFDGYSIPMIVYYGLYQILSAPALNVCDLNGDGLIDIVDIVIVAIAFGSTPGDSSWNPVADTKEPYDLIDIADIVLIALHFGET